MLASLCGSVYDTAQTVKSGAATMPIQGPIAAC